MTGKPCPTFGFFLLHPKCQSCRYRFQCLQTTLGLLAEKGYLVEIFDRSSGQHVYKINIPKQTIQVR